MPKGAFPGAKRSRLPGAPSRRGFGAFATANPTGTGTGAELRNERSSRAGIRLSHPHPFRAFRPGALPPRVSSSLPERRPPVSPGRSSEFATGPLAQKPLFAAFRSQKTVESERQKLLSEFERLRQFLRDQEHVLLGQLEKTEKNISKRQNENITDLSKEIALLNKLIAELEEKIQQPTLEFLKVRRQVSVVTFFLLFQCVYGSRRAVLGVKVLFYSVLNERVAQGDARATLSSVFES